MECPHERWVVRIARSHPLGPTSIGPGCLWVLLVLWIGSAQRLSLDGRWKGLSPAFGTRFFVAF
jgi:hypothetical protein